MMIDQVFCSFLQLNFNIIPLFPVGKTVEAVLIFTTIIMAAILVATFYLAKSRVIYKMAPALRPQRKVTLTYAMPPIHRHDSGFNLK